MCGIAGVVGVHDAALLDRLADAMSHRGPDGRGVVSRERVGLVATRLAILDVPGGAQPMSTEDGALTIVFNGEIFNAPELRAELEREGVRFASDHSDTEVVLRLYERGGDFLPRLNGMFAFVVHDARRQVLFGARDRFGIKPLYYARPGGGFAFASELRALLLVPGVERRVDPASLSHFLSLRFVPGEDSIVEGVSRLAPAHAFRYDLRSGSFTTWRWWQLAFEREERDDWAAAVREQLQRAVLRWTLSDVPVAVSLSGGLDSSAVGALLASAGGHVRTYTLGFTSEEDASLNELPLARALAERYGTEHHELVVDADDLLDDLLQMVWALDEPYGGGLPSWYVFRFMADDVKVGLTGTGGDELFGNYRRFVPFETARLARWRRSFRRYYFEPSYYLGDDVKDAIGAGGADSAALLENVFARSGSASARDSVLFLDLQTQLPDEFLHMTDRFSMAHALEARTPFLDHELVELVARIPPEQRTSVDDPKGLLRAAVGNLLPASHLEAPKRGFVLPLERWLRGPLAPLVDHLLSPVYLRRQGRFNPEYDYRALDAESLWPLLMFQLWHLLYVEEKFTAPPSFTWRDVAGKDDFRKSGKSGTIWA
jgi:asparagine synthase (glutamine-hydrolysing)